MIFTAQLTKCPRMYFHMYIYICQGSAPVEVASVILSWQTELEDDLNALANTLTTQYTTYTT